MFNGSRRKVTSNLTVSAMYRAGSFAKKKRNVLKAAAVALTQLCSPPRG